MLQPNVSSLDARARWTLAIACYVASIIFAGWPVPSFSLALVGIVIAATAVTRTCPLYSLVAHFARKPARGTKP